MKVIPLDKITSVLPSDEDSEFVADNVMDDYRTNYWLAGSAGAATLQLAASANTNALMVGYTNSGTVTVTVTDASLNVLYGPTGHTIDSEVPNFWIDWTLEAETVTIDLSFADPGGGATVYCGVCRVGQALDFSSPKYGLSEGLKDLSIDKELNNGAKYYLDRGRLRIFSGNFIDERDSAFYDFMHSLVKQYGRGPFAWKLTDISDDKWIVFGWLEGMPSGSHVAPSYSNISFSIVEGL